MTSANDKQHGVNIPTAGLVLLFFCAFWMFSFFLTPLPGDNINSRLDLTASIAGRGTLKIDPYHLNTIDKARVSGSYYSDKAPGMSFLALPVGYAFSTAAKVHPGDPVFRHAATTFAVSLPAALAAAFFAPLLAAAAGSAAAGVSLAGALVFGTLFLPYSTLFYGHATAAALSIAVFIIACRSGPVTPKHFFIAGLLSGFMVIIEYPLATHAAALFLLLVSRSDKKAVGAAAFIAGALPSAILLLLYNNAAFGGPFTLGYFHESWKPFAGEIDKGFAGLTRPGIRSLYDILFRPGRGLFFLSPFLLFAFPGFFIGLRNKKWRGPALSAGVIVVATVLVNASYFLPGGGMAAGPRHLVTCLPYMVFLCAISLAGAGKYIGGIFAGFAASSAALHILVTVTDPQPPAVFDFPAAEYSLQHFLNGVMRPSWINLIADIPPAAVILIFCSVAVLLFAASVKRAFAGNEHFSSRFTAAAMISAFVWLAVFYLSAVQLSGINSPEKEYELGRSYRALGRPALARQAYEMSIAGNPGAAPAYFGLAQLDVSAGRISEAVANYSLAVELNPAIAEAYYNLAVLYHRAGQADRAVEHYMLYVENEKHGDTRRLATACAAAALLDLSLDRPDDALDMLRRAVSYDPQAPAVDRARGMIEKYIRDHGDGNSGSAGEAPD